MHVLDGDAINVLHNQYPERIHRSWIDCHKKDKAYGEGAKQAASGLVDGQEVGILTHGLDKYGHTLAHVFLLVDTSVNHKLVKDGWCW